MGVSFIRIFFFEPQDVLLNIKLLIFLLLNSAGMEIA